MHTEAVDSGYLAVPDRGGPGVVVVHDVWGLYDHFRDVARRFAGEGFVALAVNLYRELGDVKITDPGPFMRGLSDPDMLRTLKTAVDELRAHPKNPSGRVAVVGFCMGGMYALLAGARVAGISAVVPFYAVLSHSHGLLYDPNGLAPALKPDEPLGAARELACPLLAFYGTEDVFVPLSDIHALEARLASSRATAKVEIYDGAGHAFMNDTRPAAFRPDAARDAWEKTIAFLRAHLEPKAETG